MSFLCASNVTVRRKHGSIVAIIVWAVVAGEDKPGPHEDSRKPTYAEPLGCGSIPMLKVIDGTGAFRRWNSRDAFNPRRFNPDTLPRTAREMARL